MCGAGIVGSGQNFLEDDTTGVDGDRVGNHHNSISGEVTAEATGPNNLRYGGCFEDKSRQGGHDAVEGSAKDRRLGPVLWTILEVDLGIEKKL